MLRQGVQGISDLITVPGLINLDFADVRAIMKDAGSALMGIGRASGEDRAADAAREAIASPLLEVNIAGAQGVLFNITGGPSLGLFEVDEAAEIIKETADPEANIIFGTVIDERMGDEIAITVIATGFDSSRKRELHAAAQARRRCSRRGTRDYVRELSRAAPGDGNPGRRASARSIPAWRRPRLRPRRCRRRSQRTRAVERPVARAAERGRGPRHPGLPASATDNPTRRARARHCTMSVNGSSAQCARERAGRDPASGSACCRFQSRCPPTACATHSPSG